MKLHKSIWFGLVVALVLVGVLVAVSACGGGTTGTTGPGGEKAESGGILSLRINAPSFIDPINGQESEGIKVIDCVFDSLTAFEPKTNALLPAAAEKWEANADATVWTFHLNKDGKFHNGRKVTAADFKYAWERICNPVNKSEIAYHLANIVGYDEMQAGTATELTGVKALDDNTLEVTLNAPFGDFEYTVAHPTFGPVPKEEVEKDPAAYADMPIGNGPFMMAGPWQHDQMIQVVRFDDYYGDKALLDGVDFKDIKEIETAFLEFQAGNLDWTDFPPAQTAEVIAKYGESPDGMEIYPTQQVLNGPALSIGYCTINCKDPLFKDNVDLRRALSLAINRQAIIDTVYAGLRTPADGIVPPGIAGYLPGQWAYSKYDPEQAKALLAKAGYPNGEGLPELRLGFNTGSVHGDVYALVQADLKAIGVNSVLEGVEWAQWLDQLDAFDFQLGRLGWSADFPTYNNFTYSLFYSKSPDNASGFSNAEVDAAIDAARATVNTEERIAKFQAVDKMIGDLAPVIPFFAGRQSVVGSDRIHGLVTSSMSYLNLDKVWIPKDLQ